MFGPHVGGMTNLCVDMRMCVNALCGSGPEPDMPDIGRRACQPRTLALLMPTEARPFPRA